MSAVDDPRSPAPLLLTKLAAPPARSDLVARPRLSARVGRVPLTLITAPPGFGKTTLLAEWRTTAVAAGLQPAWLSLDPADDDPARFLSYVVAALQMVWPGFGQAALAGLQSPQPAPPEVVAEALLNEAAGRRQTAVLVLDDYHAITAEPIHQALATLLEHPAASLRLVLAARADPPLPLARLRARGQLEELRAADLRLTSAEAAAFLRETMGLELPPDRVDALEARSDGWVAGLQLAALALRKAGPDARTADDDAQRYVAEYLLEEVFSRQTAETQAFLLTTSILEHLSGPLCDAVTGGQPAGQPVLDALARANLFLSRLDGAWYRLHPLFREFLAARLAQREPGLRLELHRRAADWYEHHAQPEEAIEHALAAEDAATAARLAAEAAPGRLQRGELATLSRWLARLPETVVWTQPRLVLARAWTLLDANQTAAAGADLERFDAYLESNPAPGLRGEMLAARSVYAALLYQPEQALAFARQAEAAAAGRDPFVEAYVAFSLGAAHKMNFDAVRAERSLQRALTLAEANGNTFIALSALENLADGQYNQGQLALAVQTNQRIIDLATQWLGVEPPYLGTVRWMLGRARYEWNELTAALDEAERAIALCAQWGNRSVQARGWVLRAQVLQALGQTPAASESLETAAQHARQSGDDLVARAVLRQRLSLALAQGDLTSARHWLTALLVEAPHPYPFFHALAAARLRLAEGQPAEALHHLDQAGQALEPTNLVVVRAQVLALRALAQRARGQADEALATLEQALALGQPGGLVRTFVDEGPAMRELLRRAAAHSAAPAYLGRVLAAFPEESLPEALTERERQILRLLAAGLSNREMAAQLVIAEGTLKRHVANVYLKLGAHSRTQALARAAALKLV